MPSGPCSATCVRHRCFFLSLKSRLMRLQNEIAEIESEEKRSFSAVCRCAGARLTRSERSFRLAESGCVQVLLDPGNRCLVSVRFQPDSKPQVATSTANGCPMLSRFSSLVSRALRERRVLPRVAVLHSTSSHRASAAAISARTGKASTAVAQILLVCSSYRSSPGLAGPY